MSKGVPPQNPRQVLKAVSYFAGLDASALALVERAVIRRMYEPGKIVFIAGEPSSGLYVIEEGWLKVVKTGLDGREQTLQTLGPGDVFNALSVFTEVPNQATVEALEKSTLWLMPREAMLRLLDENPSMAQAVIQDLAGRVQHLISLVEDLSLRSVEARLARRLLEQAKGEAVQRKQWATQAEMASRLGTVPDVLNRALRKLAEQGLISVARHQIQILDEEGLKEVAQVME